MEWHWPKFCSQNVSSPGLSAARPQDLGALGQLQAYVKCWSSRIHPHPQLMGAPAFVAPTAPACSSPAWETGWGKKHFLAKKQHLATVLGVNPCPMA